MAIEKQEHYGLRRAWAQVVEESSQDRIPEKSATCGCSNFPTAKTRIMPHVSVCVCMQWFFLKTITDQEYWLTCVWSSPGQWALNWLKLSQVCEAIGRKLPYIHSICHGSLFTQLIMDAYELYYPYFPCLFGVILSAKQCPSSSEYFRGCSSRSLRFLSSCWLFVS